nr:MAG TPA: hypothetical protein [Caudoviricetes sp.]
MKLREICNLIGDDEVIICCDGFDIRIIANDVNDNQFTSPFSTEDVVNLKAVYNDSVCAIVVYI